MVNYKSTRGNGKLYSASEAIIKGLSDDGGLFVPDSIPSLTESFSELQKMNYQQVVFTVLKKFLSDFSDDEINYCISNAYDEKFDTKEIAPMVRVGDKFFLELFHGPTIAFKDMALSILPYLLSVSAKKNNVSNNIVILTATSGDTGKAALAGFADVPGTKIIVFYPKGGVSKIQELQMVTQKGNNTFVVGVNGNFDDAQTGVKKMFNDPTLNELLNKSGLQFSSANSINIGRLIPQIAYYVWSYLCLLNEGAVREGESINITVPTGNFGNILAAYYAKQMGIPVNKLICASNINNVLTAFINEGIYDKNRDFILTSSPSMDILVSSNLERLVYKAVGEDEKKNIELMERLSLEGHYSLDDNQKIILKDFYGGYVNEEENYSGIKQLYDDYHYVIDTHTGIANSVYDKYVCETDDKTPTVIVSTASPYKFPEAVVNSIDESYIGNNDFAFIDRLCNISGIPAPKAVDGLQSAAIIHNTVCDICDMEGVVKKFLEVE